VSWLVVYNYDNVFRKSVPTFMTVTAALAGLVWQEWFGRTTF